MGTYDLAVFSKLYETSSSLFRTEKLLEIASTPWDTLWDGDVEPSMSLFVIFC